LNYLLKLFNVFGLLIFLNNICIFNYPICNVLSTISKQKLVFNKRKAINSLINGFLLATRNMFKEY